MGWQEEMEEVDITPTDPQSELPSAQEAEPRAMDVAVATADEASAKAAEIEKWIAEASADDILHGFDTLFDKMDGLPEETVSALVEKTVSSGRPSILRSEEHTSEL